MNGASYWMLLQHTRCAIIGESSRIVIPVLPFPAAANTLEAVPKHSKEEDGAAA